MRLHLARTGGWNLNQNRTRVTFMRKGKDVKDMPEGSSSTPLTEAGEAEDCPHHLQPQTSVAPDTLKQC